MKRGLIIGAIILVVLLIVVGVLYFTFNNKKVNSSECGPGVPNCLRGIDESRGKYFKLGEIKEGEKFEIPLNEMGKPSGTNLLNQACSNGLNPVVAKNPTASGCGIPRCPCYVCVKCGDNICGIGENKCNCPEDCGNISQEGTLTSNNKTICSKDILDKITNLTNNNSYKNCTKVDDCKILTCNKCINNEGFLNYKELVSDCLEPIYKCGVPKGCNCINNLCIELAN